MKMYRKVHNENYISKVLLKIIVTFIVATISIVLYDMYININVERPPIVSGGTIASTEETKTEKDICDTLENVSNTVVGISKLQSTDATFFSLDAIETYNLGTGVIVSKEGYVLTNYHVSGKKSSKCYVTLEDKKEYTAQVIWTDENLDLSVLKINTNIEFNYAKLGDSDSLRIGQGVYAIGNPLGAEFQKTVTSGIISALDRTIKIEDENKSSYMEDLVQTDASINSGNSGGPLIDKEGNVIGITTVKIKDAEGIGFAIPINIVKPIIEKLEEIGKFEEASLGVYVYDREAIQYINSSLNFEYGVYVTEVISEGAAKLAGIRVGDIIEKIDGIKLNKINDLRKHIYTKNVNDEVKLTILRNKQEFEITAKLTKKL